MSAQGGIDANVTASAERWFTGYVNTDISGSALDPARGLDHQPVRRDRPQPPARGRHRTSSPTSLTGEPIEHRQQVQQLFQQGPVSCRRAGRSSAGRTMRIRLNARWQPSRFDLFQNNRVTPVDGAPHDDNLFQHYRRPGDRAWRRRHPAARRRRDQARRARDPAQARRRRHDTSGATG